MIAQTESVLMLSSDRILGDGKFMDTMPNWVTFLTFLDLCNSYLLRGMTLGLLAVTNKLQVSHNVFSEHIPMNRGMRQ